ncbi:MAG TPA: family 78 glycoside hydrolase catalytic domain [Clostridiales bacterium]|nr:family 78 glycoside hydrolase catalytic domain [Clostridiales bacterium]
MIRLSKLRCLNMKKPLGIDSIPYFSWIIESDQCDVMQAAYQITVTDQEGGIVWDTGRVESGTSAFVPYEGTPLQSRTTYQWTVTVTDNYGNEASANSIFESAFLEESEWVAKWVESPLDTFERAMHFSEQPCASMFRKAFRLKGKVVKARLYATCHGIYRLTVNGKRPDDREFAPEFTVYRDYLSYQTYDVTSLLEDGENVVGMYVGDGWYHCYMSKTVADDYNPAHAILLQIEVEYDNGTRETVVSDETVKVSEGPVRFSDLYAGECFDANLIPHGWDVPGYDDTNWQEGRLADHGYKNLKAQYGQPVRPVMTLPVVAAAVSPKGEHILDFGQVIAGRVRFRVHAPKGQAITLEHTEGLDKDGNFFINNPTADQRVVYISDGNPSVYEPYFTFHGFRYVQVSGLEAINPEDFTAVVISSEKENTGTFECSNQDVNRLYENTRWSQRANMLSIPTDCPQREKAGWTGDIQVYTTTALLNEDVTPFLTRWLKNLAIEQRDNGSVPCVVPNAGAWIGLEKGYEQQYNLPGEVSSAGWSDAAVLVPYYMYQVTGNTRILQEQYKSMKSWCDYVLRTAKNRRPPESSLPDEVEQYLWNSGFHYGEHLIPSYSKDGYGEGTYEAIRISQQYVAPIYAYYSVSSLSEIAGVLKKAEDAAYYKDMAEKIKDAYGKGVIREDGRMPAELMGAYAMSIYYGLVPEQHKQLFADRLVQILKDNGGCLDTGFLGTPILQDALCKIGRVDLAYELLYQEKAPSWLYEVQHGATTIWESWYALAEDGTPFCSSLGDMVFTMSLNHYAFGCVDDWIFRYVNGIDKSRPGYKHIMIHPQPDERMQWAKRTFSSEYGDIVSDWRKENGTFHLSVKIPCNTTADIILPDGTAYAVGSGHYEYSCLIH